MYDLNIIPINLRQGDPIAPSPGFYTAAPPRRAARSRSEDMLILSLFTSGGGIPAEKQREMLESLAQTFYKTSGSVTAALRTLIETLNLTMLEDNLKSTEQKNITNGLLTVAALHRRNLYFAQSGQTHASVLTQQGLQQFSDTSQSDRGLGVSRKPSIRYYQANLGNGGYVFMTNNPLDTWNEEALFAGQFPTLPQLRRRLLNQAPPDFRLDLIQVVPGEGQIHIFQSEEQPTASATSSKRDDVAFAEAPTPVPQPQKQEEQETVELSDTQELKAQSQPAQVLENEAPPEVPQTEEPPQPHPTSTEDAVPSRKETFQKKTEILKEEGLKGLQDFFKWWRKVKGRVNAFFKDLITRWSPEGSEAMPRLSKRTLVIIAILVPLVVVGVAVGVYLARGRTLQYNYYLNQAVTASQHALSAEDPQDSRSKWAQALTHLDQAESYRSTDEIKALRDQAQDALDLLDGAVRLEYHPAIIGSLYSEIKITGIISFGADLYLFDSAGGRVIHADRASQGYEIDPDFVCAAGNYNGVAVGALMDMTSLPINNPYNAHILAVDDLGNAVYCAPGEEPVVHSLPGLSTAEDEMYHIAYESGYLYLLNPAANTLQVFKSDNGQFLEPPTDFFEGSEAGEKPDMSQIVDLDVNGQELYLLREDGMLANCISSGLTSDPVNCVNPVTYLDGRIEKEDQEVAMPDGAYRSVLYTDPPDPSIYILESENADIYQFSLRFRLYKRLRPDLGTYEVQSPTATAFTVGIDRIAFLAFGHQVFYAYVK